MHQDKSEVCGGEGLRHPQSKKRKSKELQSHYPFWSQAPTQLRKCACNDLTSPPMIDFLKSLPAPRSTSASTHASNTQAFRAGTHASNTGPLQNFYLALNTRVIFFSTSQNYNLEETIR